VSAKTRVHAPLAGTKPVSSPLTDPNDESQLPLLQLAYEEDEGPEIAYRIERLEK
jgi:hypothetical protein